MDFTASASISPQAPSLSAPKRPPVQRSSTSPPSKPRHRTRPPHTRSPSLNSIRTPSVAPVAPTLTRTMSHSRIPLTRRTSANFTNKLFDTKDKGKDKVPSLVRKDSKSKRAEKAPASTLPRSFGNHTRSRKQLELKVSPPSTSPETSTSSIECYRDKPLPKTPLGTPTLRPVSLRVRKKRSLPSLITAPTEEELSSDPSSSSSSLFSEDDKALETPTTEPEDFDDDGKMKFNVHEKNYFHRQSGMRYHPFDATEAPYMQGYDRILLDKYACFLQTSIRCLT